MEKPLPMPTRLKKNVPAETLQVETQPEVSEEVHENPQITSELTETPQVSEQKTELPAESPEKETMPSDYNEENCVTIAGKKIEIKSTKVKYFRNGTITRYNLLKIYPLSDVMMIPVKAVDERRDGDQIVYDFLVAALNDREFVRDNYNEMDADQIERIVQIIGRVNHFDEKEEQQRKNMKAQGEAKH